MSKKLSMHVDVDAFLPANDEDPSMLQFIHVDTLPQTTKTSFGCFLK